MDLTGGTVEGDTAIGVVELDVAGAGGDFPGASNVADQPLTSGNTDATIVGRDSAGCDQKTTSIANGEFLAGSSNRRCNSIHSRVQRGRAS